MGITEFDVAEQALIRSIELHSSAINDVQAGEMTANPADLGNRILQNMQSQYDPYVDEEPVSLGSWRPPNDEGDFPARWYACAPNNRENWKPTALLGWRTKLERAIQREDEDKVKDIVSRYDLQDIREFVECRMLLTKCAQRGLIDACKLLMEDCKASVEGAQAPDAENWWLDVQNGSGNCDALSPLHQACRNGQEEAVKLLLGHGADINRVDKGKLCGSALHHAVSGGQIDCCRILCEKGVDHTYEDWHGHCALEISELVAVGNIYRTRVQEKIQQILREYDTRCSCCQHSNAAKKCPCQMERYCNAACQKRRWKKDRKYHKEIAGC